MHTTPIVEAIDLHKTISIGSQQLNILQGIELAVYPGESLAILGKSGSGKSTLLSLLAGLDQPSSGQVRLSGQVLSQLNEDQRARLRSHYLGFVFQSFQLLPNLSALENVMLPLELKADPQAKQQARLWLDRVGLKQRSQHLANQLSGGEQQRVALARAFVAQPKLLLADEPTGNLDKDTGNQIMQLLFQLNHEQGTTLLLITHDDALARLCQRRSYLAQGQLQERS